VVLFVNVSSKVRVTRDDKSSKVGGSSHDPLLRQSILTSQMTATPRREDSRRTITCFSIISAG